MSFSAPVGDVIVGGGVVVPGVGLPGGGVVPGPAGLPPFPPVAFLALYSVRLASAKVIK